MLDILLVLTGSMYSQSFQYLESFHPTSKDFLWRLELPISTWGAVFQGFTTSLPLPWPV